MCIQKGKLHSRTVENSSLLII